MIRTASSKQLTIDKFGWPFDMAVDKNNRWEKLSVCIPRDQLAESYYRGLKANSDRPLKEAHGVIGVIIIKPKQCLSNEETVQ